MMGGYPGATNGYRFKRSSDVLERMADSHLVEDVDELSGEDVTLELRQIEFLQTASDVYAVLCSAAGGFGDPLDREPESVRADVEQYSVTAEAAKQIYGVVLAEGAIDMAATEALRSERRAQRKGNGSVERSDEPVVVELTENLHLRGGNYCCAKCAAKLAQRDSNYKDGCVCEDHAVSSSNPLIGDPARFIDDDPVFRQFFCPGCGSLIENEVAMRTDPYLMDLSLTS